MIVIILFDSFYYARLFHLLSFSRSFSMPCASFSSLGGSGGTGCDKFNFLVHNGWDSTDVSVVGVFVSKSV